MKGFLGADNKWRFPATVTESFMSVNYIELIESGQDVPEEMMEAYDYYVKNNKKANSYTSKDVPFKVYDNICSIIGNITNDTILEYFPLKVDSLIYYKFDKDELQNKLKDLLACDFDYILHDNVLYYSRKLGVDFYKTISVNTSTIISVEGVLSKITDDTIITEQKYNKKLASRYHLLDFHSNYRGSIVKTKILNYEKLTEVLTSRFSRVILSISGDGSYVYTVNICPMFSKISPIIKYSYLNNIVTIKVSKCSCSIEYNMIMKLADMFLSSYDVALDNIGRKSLAILRTINPELFVQQYSRESQVLPIPCDPEEYSLEFPLGSGKYYKAPEGYYPGLKENRLHNKDIYPLIITCYRTDHSINPHKLTYKYYNGIFDNLSPNVSMKDCFNVPFTFKVYKEVILQEQYKANLQTYSEFYNDYRYCEEMYNINIIVIRNGNVLIPDHVEPYYWNYYNYRKTYVIEQTKKNLGLSHKKIDVDPEQYIKMKLSKTKRSTYDNSLDYTHQYIDFNGKVRMLKLRDGSWIDCVGAPLNLPTENVRDETIRNIERISKGFFRRIKVNHIDKPLEINRHYYVHIF